MTTTKALKSVAGLLVIVVLAVYAEYVREEMQSTPDALLVCIDQRPALLSWTCEQILERRSLRPTEVAALNKDAGARYPMYLHDPKMAEKMLALFVSRGVDINAPGESTTTRRTAIYDPIFDAKLDRIEMLLRHGARVDVRDALGDTPLDYARKLQQQMPTEPARAAVVKMLETATHQH
jgi:hypothetical protein